MENNHPTDLSSSAELSAKEEQNLRQDARDLRDELADLKQDLDSLMSKATALADRELRNVWGQLNGQLGNAQGSARDMAGQAGEQLNRGVEVTTDYVRERPMQALAIAAGLGLLIGALRR